MAALVLTNAQILLGSSTAAADISSFIGTLDTTATTVTIQDVTTFTSGGYVINQSALKSGEWGVSGFADFTTTTGINALFTPASLGVQHVGVINPTGGTTTGDDAVFTRGPLKTYTPWGGAVGEAAKCQFALATDTAGPVSGFVLAPLASRGALVGTQVSGVPAVTATQQVWACLVVTGAVGTNLAVKVQSAATGDSGFASPTDRITFSTTSAAGVQFASTTVGAITDTRWRMNATVGGSTFTYFVAMGVM